MTRAELVGFLRGHRLAIQASVAPGGAPQAAVVGFAVSDALEIIFDTVESSRKYRNLRADPRIALVIGWDGEITAQLEGIADFPQGTELDRVRGCYFSVFPDGRLRLGWLGITHVRVHLTWARLSDYTREPPLIDELDVERLR